MQDSDLLKQLVEDLGIARQLLELTDFEFQALTERDLAGLEKLITQKQTLLALLSQHGSLRGQALNQRQLSVDRKGLEALASTSIHGKEILARSEELDDLLQSCRNANERNGRLIRANRTAVSSMLDVLKGGNQTPDLYDRRGSTAKTSYQRPLSQA